VARSFRSSSVNNNFKFKVDGNSTNRAISHRRWMSVVGASVASQQDSQEKLKHVTAAVSLAALGLVFVGSTADVSSAQCEEMKQIKTKKTKHWTPAEVAKENLDDVIQSHDINKFPEYTSDQVAEKDGEDGKPVWMSYGGIVYDVTDFILNHPGGSEKIMMAAGSVRGKNMKNPWRHYRIFVLSGSCSTYFFTTIIVY
jgi:predicted heme/steroid binding protein